MKYLLEYSDEAMEGMLKHQKSGDKQAIKKMDKLLDEIEIHPTTGTGKPERLKHFKGNHWSREIMRKHRLMYEIFEDEKVVYIMQTWGHYDDK